ncbi:MAG: hypothetical protein WKF59_21505 [Chitinophagaceae bacterium]
MIISNTPIEIGAEMTMEALTGLPSRFYCILAKSTFVLPLDLKALDTNSV